MPTPVTAQKGDTLCTIAINAGFNDCTPIRAIAANAPFTTRALVPGDIVIVPDLTPSDIPKPTDSLHKFEIKGRTVSIRFVHGSANMKYADDLELTELNISNFHTDLCGIPEGPKLPNAAHAHFDLNADKDSDTFKVEVLDTRPPAAPLEVIVEPLLPTYDAGDNLSGHTNFPGDPKVSGTVRGFRSLIGKAHKMEGKRFRTGYLRLVVDSLDAAARSNQTVLVTDNVGNGDRKAEILDQDVKATYLLKDCPFDEPAKCRVETVATIGRGQVVHVALHVLRATPSGIVETVQGGPGDNGVVTLKEIQGRIDTFCRDYWAQDTVKFKTVLARTVDLPSNMLTVSDLLGAFATGTAGNGAGQGQVSFTVNVQRFGVAPDSTHQVGPILVGLAAAPVGTANDIATALNALPGITATVSVNPAEVRSGALASNLGSVDILIADSTKGRITITNLSGPDVQDATQVVTVCNVTLSFPTRNALTNYHVGSPEERNLYKTYDTGDDRLDIFVIQSFAGAPNLVGFTVCAQTDLHPSRRPISGMFNTIIMRQDASDSTDTFPYALPHEIGHALLDCAQHADDKHQLMFPITAPFNDVNDAKRLIAVDTPSPNWDNLVTNSSLNVVNQRIRMNTLTRLFEKSSGLLH